MTANGAKCARVDCSFTPLVAVDNATSTLIQHPFCSTLCEMFVGAAWIVSKAEWNPTIEALSEYLVTVNSILNHRTDPSDWPVELQGFGVTDASA
ncbi:hypothetical protein [Streptomyces tubercidicus]|uniref:hypothetical protein n=1 Tax=Streptomyces tubercidicus TaxID=47759 RepID=UPI0037966B0D